MYREKENRALKEAGGIEVGQMHRFTDAEQSKTLPDVQITCT